MQDYRKLKVFQQAHQLVLAVYQVTKTFPDDERFGITSQLRRAVMSVPANIAEGSVRGSDADFARFLQISLGSLVETDYFLLLAHDLQLMDETTYLKLTANVEEIRRMLIGFIQHLKKRR